MSVAKRPRSASRTVRQTIGAPETSSATRPMFCQVMSRVEIGKWKAVYTTFSVSCLPPPRMAQRATSALEHQQRLGSTVRYTQQEVPTTAIVQRLHRGHPRNAVREVRFSFFGSAEHDLDSRVAWIVCGADELDIAFVYLS